jgi:4-hydroxy-3-methylbut-2-enyl diphosphate reductase
LSQKITTFFIEDADAISEDAISFLQLKSMQVESQTADWKNWNRVVLASGASCPDTLVDQVVQKVLSVKNIDVTPQLALQQWMSHE